jgi:hypothetical protein
MSNSTEESAVPGVEKSFSVYSSLVSEIKPVPTKFDNVEIAIRPDGGLVSTLVKALRSSLSFDVMGEGFNGEKFAPLLERYFLHLTYSRVMHVRGERGKGFDFIAPNRPGLQIPAFWVVILNQIGEVVDHEFGVRFVPQMDKLNTDVPLSTEELFEVWTWLAAAKRHGLDVSSAYVIDRRGSYDFMAFQALEVNSEIVMAHHRQVPPVMALLAAFVVRSSIRDVFVPRLTYLPVSLVPTLLPPLMTIGRR